MTRTILHHLAAALLAVVGLLPALPASGCTSILVGKKASACGSAFITYNQDDYGMYGRLTYLPAARHAKGDMRRIVNGDNNHFMGFIPEAEQTYAVMGYINEHQVAITETTFGGREELHDTTGIIDYTSLITLALQRSRTAREAISVMTTLVQQHGYASEGESFSIADPNEVWILEMIGKGGHERGAVWVAVRIPDDCIACHANQSRIHRFDRKDKQNVLCSRDVISFARKQGYFSGRDEDFSFADAYAPADFSGMRFCEARVWSFYNKWVDGMDKYLDYVDGRHIGQAEPMPLYFRARTKLTLADVMESMRDHYEGTPFDVTTDCGAGPYQAPYRPTPLTWEYEGRRYFNERPISTQQTAATMVIQVRPNMPNAVGGIIWFGNDDPNMVPFTPIYCSATAAPVCYDTPDASDVKFSWQSAFWVQNWVANMTYPRYSQLFPSLRQARAELEQGYLAAQHNVEEHALKLYQQSPDEAIRFLTHYSSDCATRMMQRWTALGQYLIVKYNDQVVRPEKDGRFLLTPDSLGQRPVRPGFNDAYKRTIIRETGNKYLMP